MKLIRVCSMPVNGKCNTISRKTNHTFVGSRLTRPQARAATPLQLCETAMIPMESGPGCNQIFISVDLNKKKHEWKEKINILHSFLVQRIHYLHPNHLHPFDSSSCRLRHELCQGLLSNSEKTAQIKSSQQSFIQKSTA